MYRVKLAWAWLMANMWALWAAVFMGIAAVWLMRSRKPQIPAGINLGSVRTGEASMPTVWEEAAAFGAEEAAHHREEREKIIADRERELGQIGVQEQKLDEIQQEQNPTKRTEEMAAWLEDNL